MKVDFAVAQIRQLLGGSPAPSAGQ